MIPHQFRTPYKLFGDEDHGMMEDERREAGPLLTSNDSDREPGSGYSTLANTDQPDGHEESQGGPDKADQREGIPEVRSRLKFIVPAISIGIFLAAADQTLVASSYGKIGSELKALNKSSWISTVYFLSLTSFQPLYGKLSDIFGRKPALLLAYSVFGLGCLFCGLARTMEELIVSRALAGIGGGGMTVVVSILMSDIVPLRERGTWQGIINIIYASGAGAGAPLGGLLADYLSWRWAFILQAPCCALAIGSVALALKLPPSEVQDWKTKIKRVDFLGSFVLILTVFALLLGLDRGSNDSWRSPITIVALSLTLPLLLLFLYVEFRSATEPLAPKRIVLNRSLLACYACNFFAFAAWMAILFYLPLYYQAVNKFSASKAGLGLLPAIVASVTGSLFGGLVMQRTGRYYSITVFAYAISAIAIIPVILFSGLVANSFGGISVGLVLSGFGNGIGVTTSLIALIANAAPEDLAIVTACSYLFRSSGSVIGISLASTVVQQSLREQLRNRMDLGADAGDIARNVRESLQFIDTLSPNIQEVVRECYGSSVRHSFLLSCLLAAAAAVGSWFIKEKSLTR